MGKRKRSKKFFFQRRPRLFNYSEILFLKHYDKRYSFRKKNILKGSIETETNLSFYKKYHKDFQESGVHKGETVLNQIDSLAQKPHLSRLAYISIGGSEGSEIDYILRNSEFKYGILSEVDTYACQIAEQKVDTLDSLGKTLKIIPGDITSQTILIQNTLKKWAEESKINGILISAQAVLHELPHRSPGFDFNSFFGEMLKYP